MVSNNCRRARRSSLAAAWQATVCWSAMVPPGAASGSCPTLPSGAAPSHHMPWCVADSCSLHGGAACLSRSIHLLETVPVPVMLRCLEVVDGLCVQAMGSATRELLAGAWAGSGPREVYADLNELTLRITTEALFGSNLPPQEAARVTGPPSPC